MEKRRYANLVELPQAAEDARRPRGGDIGASRGRPRNPNLLGEQRALVVARHAARAGGGTPADLVRRNGSVTPLADGTASVDSSTWC